MAAAAGKFHLFNFALNLTQSYTFWAGVLGGTFLTMASHGTDQLMVQRMLAARNLRESRLALLSSGGVIFLQFTLFLLIGVGLVCVLRTASGGVRFGGPNLPDVHRAGDAGWGCGAAGRGDSCGSDVESERGAELAFVDDGSGFLHALAAGARMTASA